MGAGHLKFDRLQMRGNNLSYEIFREGELWGLSSFFRLVSGSFSVSVRAFVGR